MASLLILFEKYSNRQNYLSESYHPSTILDFDDICVQARAVTWPRELLSHEYSHEVILSSKPDLQSLFSKTGFEIDHRISYSESLQSLTSGKSNSDLTLKYPNSFDSASQSDILESSQTIAFRSDLCGN